MGRFLHSASLVGMTRLCGESAWTPLDEVRLFHRGNVARPQGVYKLLDIVPRTALVVSLDIVDKFAVPLCFRLSILAVSLCQPIVGFLQAWAGFDGSFIRGDRSGKILSFRIEDTELQECRPQFGIKVDSSLQKRLNLQGILRVSGSRPQPPNAHGIIVNGQGRFQLVGHAVCWRKR